MRIGKHIIEAPAFPAEASISKQIPALCSEKGCSADISRNSAGDITLPRQSFFSATDILCTFFDFATVNLFLSGKMFFYEENTKNTCNPFCILV